MKRFLFFVFLLCPGLVFAAGPVYFQNLKVYDQGDLSTDSGINIDTRQGSCESGDDVEDEDFFAANLGISVFNAGTTTLRARKFRYRFRIPGEGRVRSGRLSPFGLVTAIAPDEEAEIYVPFFDPGEGGVKKLAGKDRAVPEFSGVRRVRLRLVFQDERGERVRLRARASLIMDNIDRCE